MPASALVRRVFIGLLVANVAVVGVKLWVGFASGSLAVLGGAVDSCVDALNNVVALIVIRVAAKEPDEDHPYGHEKFETLGTLGIVGFLSITCFELLRQSIGELTGTLSAPSAGVADGLLMIASLAVNAWVVIYERRRGRQLGSALLLADAAHTASDILVTALAIASLALSHLGYVRADALLGMLVALIIAWS